MVKNPPANAGDAGEVGLIPGLGRSPGEEVATHSSVPVWRIPWTDEPGGPQSIGGKESDTAEHYHHTACDRSINWHKHFARCLAIIIKAEHICVCVCVYIYIHINTHTQVHIHTHYNPAISLLP